MAGFPSRQPWTNIALAAAGLTLAVGGPVLGWGTALLVAVLAPAAVFVLVLGVSFAVSRAATSEADTDEENES